MRATTTEQRTWWARPGLGIADGRLTIAGRDAEQLAREHGTPLFVYDLERAREQAEALRDAFDGGRCARPGALRAEGSTRPGLPAVPSGTSAVRRHRRLFAGRARVGARARLGARGDQLHRHEPVRPRSRRASCRPAVTSTSTCCRSSNGSDEPRPDARVGIRVNPRAGATHAGGSESAYAGAKPTKFGVYPERLARGRRDRPPPRPHDRHGARALRLPLLQRLARRGRRGHGAGRRGRRDAARCGLPDRRGEHRRRARGAVPPDR